MGLNFVNRLFKCQSMSLHVYRTFSTLNLLKFNPCYYVFQLKVNNELLNMFALRSLHLKKDSVYEQQQKFKQQKFEQKFEQQQFEQKENDSAFQVISSIINYNDNKFVVPRDKHPYYNKFIKCSAFDFNFEVKKHIELVNGLVDELKSYDFDQLSNILYLLYHWNLNGKIIFEKNLQLVWSTVDDHLTKYLNNELELSENDNLIKALNISCIIYKLGIFRRCQFNLQLFKKLQSSKFELNKNHLLLIAFILNVQRNDFYNLIKEYLNENFLRLINDMSLEEIGVLCLAYFKTKNKLSTKLMNEIIKKLSSDMNNITNYSMLSSIFKALRFTFDLNYSNDIKMILAQAKQIFNQLNEQTQTQINIILLAVRYEIYEPDLINKLVDNLCMNINSFRIKDIEKVFQCLSTFNHNISANKLNHIANEIYRKKLDEISRFPLNFLTTLYYMSIIEYYPRNLLNYCFQSDFLSNLQKKSPYNYHDRILTLNTCLLIENYDEFNKILLPNKEVNYYHKRLLKEESSTWHENTIRFNITKNIYNILESVYQPNIILHYLLPFKSHPSLLILTENIDHNDLSFNQLKKGKFQDCIVINVLSKYDYLYNEPTKLRGSIQLQNRLLEKLGFKVIKVSYEQMNFFKTEHDLRNYMLSLIREQQ